MGKKTINFQTLIRSCLFPAGLIVAFLAIGFSCHRCLANEALSDTFVSIIKNIKPTVVNVRATMIANHEIKKRKKHDQFHDSLSGNIPRKQASKRHGIRMQGSGIIADSKGHIITNNHIVENANKIIVGLADGHEFEAEIIGTDPKTDIAVLKINAENLKPAKFGDSDSVEVGEIVLAIGCPFGMEQLVASGIISAKGSKKVRFAEYANFLQTDAIINSGNTGGPLVNLQGEVVGVNTTIVTQADGAYPGINFAVPVKIVLRILDDLIEHGKVTRGWLGVTAQTITPQLQEILKLKNKQGALVSDIEPGSPASVAGMKSGDVVITYDGNKIKDLHHLQSLVTTTEINEKVELAVLRDGEELKLKVTIVKQPKSGSINDLLKNLGLVTQTLTQELASNLGHEGEKGVVLTNIKVGSPAFKSGLRVGDLIIEIQHKPVTNIEEFRQALFGIPPGDDILMLVKRQDGQTGYVVLKVKEIGR